MLIDLISFDEVCLHDPDVFLLTAKSVFSCFKVTSFDSEYLVFLLSAEPMEEEEEDDDEDDELVEESFIFKSNAFVSPFRSKSVIDDEGSDKLLFLFFVSFLSDVLSDLALPFVDLKDGDLDLVFPKLLVVFE